MRCEVRFTKYEEENKVKVYHENENGSSPQMREVDSPSKGE